MWSKVAVISAVVMMLAGSASAELVRLDTPGDKGWLGVYLGTMKDGEGVKILGMVGDDSPAAIAGLEEGDVIVRLNGEEIVELKSLVEIIQDSSPGETITIDLNRDGDDETVFVVLGTRPSNIALNVLQGKGGFAFAGKNPMAFILRSGDGEWSGELEKIMDGVDFEAGQVKVKVECEDGEGTVTVERDGETTVHDFDCGEDWDAHKSMMFNWHNLRGDDDNVMFGMPHIMKLHIPNMDLDFDLEDIGSLHGLPGLKRHFSAIHMQKSASTRFNVDSDGGITVTVRKGDSELNLNFDSAADLQQSRPELYEKYADLIEELE